jgi:hypothetical protein
MLHDPGGLGRYRIRSGDLVSELLPGEASASLVDPDRLVYLWVKRRSKGQDGRLGEVAAAAAARFARVLVVAKAIPAPGEWSTPVWYCREVVPVRLRPGLVVSHARRPSGMGGPDLELTAGMTVDAVVAQLVRSMHGRLIR